MKTSATTRLVKKKQGGYAKTGYDGYVRVSDGDNKPFYVHVKSDGYSVNGMTSIAALTQPVAEIDLEELDRNIRKRFNVLEMMSEAVIAGKVRGLIVSGAPGIGKTHTFERDLNRAHEEGEVENLIHIKGKVTPLYLYETLFKNSGENDVVLLDDSDNMFEDETSLNILKASTDSGDCRMISYGSTCKYLEDNDIPSQFEFKGTVVFITNLDFVGMIERGTRMAPHFKALLSRSHYLSLGVYTNTEILVRVQQVAAETPLLASRGIDEATTQEMITWMWDNVDAMREVSIRTLLKLADYAKMDEWKEMAEIMLLK
ncbi:P-loop containing nucleoside triphosphate hydrolase [Vibrio phage 1.244.A._10N.261.54.C3]|nr:P-loop containing nucleoside triphosphate hydrolase [Vibrio phage 1.244.A._10N.261.54.C3]AUR98655.1 P-loop containing nucleoside triphosphate hydrolase [Vibrio phage 1.255.O._10N.286.45.F1]